MTAPDPQPTDVQALEAFLESQPTDVRELFQYALARLMVEEGKGVFGVESAGPDGRMRVQVVTPTGQTFSVTKPVGKDAMLEQMMAIVRMAKDEGKPS